MAESRKINIVLKRHCEGILCPFQVKITYFEWSLLIGEKDM